jgi:hypothetical protein
MEGQPVECHSGYTYAQRPTAIHWEGQRCRVDAIMSEHNTPQGKNFRVRAVNGDIFTLLFDYKDKTWKIEKTNKANWQV